MKTTVEQVKALVWALADELNAGLSRAVVEPYQQDVTLENISLKKVSPNKGKLYIKPCSKGYEVVPSFADDVELMSPFLVAITGKKHKRYVHKSLQREPIWELEDWEDVRKAAYFFAQIPYQSSLAVIQQNFETKLSKALQDSSEQRRRRLATASIMPLTTQVTTRVFLRNPDVVAEALYRANGFCEVCRKPAPFLKKADSSPYLEVHHIKRLADGGHDSLENVLALCPNCHRQAHYGITQ